MIEFQRGLSFVIYDDVQDGDEFQIPFEFLARDHVRGYVGNRVVPIEWKDSTTLTIPDQAGLITPPYDVTFRRFTPLNDLVVKHRDGAKLPARDLRMAFQQLLFLLQEFLDFGSSGAGGLPGGSPGTGDGGSIDDINTIIDEIMRSPALQDLLTEIELIGINAETIIENILRDANFHDISRNHGDKISKAETEITLLEEARQVIAKQLTELFARVDTTDASMQAQYLQLNEAIANEISARVTALTELHAQVVEGDEAVSAALNQRISTAESTIETATAATEERLQAQLTDDKAALNVRIDSVETNAESTLAMTEQTLIAQFTAADDALNTALTQMITEVETNAESARAAQKNLILTQLNDSIGVVQQQISTKVTASEASALASTQVEAFKNNQFAALQQNFNVVAGEHAGMYGQWQVNYSVKINAGTIGGKPVIAGIALSANPATGSDFIVMADRFAVVSPYYTSGGTHMQLKFPFVVGTVGGVSTVGITGQLLVDGSITANKITTNTLSAITANAGTINGGTFKTHTLNSQGQVINPLEFRAEISNVGNWPLWIGTGAKSANNAVMWVDRQGNAMFKGKINASNIVGDFQERTWIHWTGMALTYQNTNGFTAGIGHTPVIAEFTLPAPKSVGDSHTPYLDVVIEMKDMTASVTVLLEMWSGSSWLLVAQRQGPYTHLAWSGNDNTRPVMEKYIPFSGFHEPQTGPRTYRLRVTSAYARNPNSNTGLSAYVTRVNGYIVGIR